MNICINSCFYLILFKHFCFLVCYKNIYKKTLWPQSTSKLNRTSDHHLLSKLVPIFADGGCCVVSATGPYGRILDFLDRSHYFFFHVAPQLYSRG
jgi:hypothetical protein